MVAQSHMCYETGLLAQRLAIELAVFLAGEQSKEPAAVGGIVEEADCSAEGLAVASAGQGKIGQ